MQRPSSVTVFGVLNIFFGALNLLTIYFLISPPEPDGPEDAMTQLLNSSPPLNVWDQMSEPLAVVSLVLGILSGVGLLQYRAWGRKLALTYGTFDIIVAVSGLVLVLTCMLPMLLEGSALDPLTRVMLITVIIASVIGSLISLIYASIMVYFMMSPRVATSFLPTPQPPPLPSEV